MNNNDSIANFIKINNINEAYILEQRDSFISLANAVSHVISSFGLYKNPKKSNVCVFDIIGKDKGVSDGILAELNMLFDKHGNLYARRSLSMLNYSSDEVVSKLEKSFLDDPVELKEIQKDQYVVGNNGMHRCVLLKVHLLNELSNGSDINSLREKYTIPAIVLKLDTVKTYSVYLLKQINSFISAESELDSNLNKTGNIILDDEFGNKYTFSDNQLIEYVNSKIATMTNKKYKESIAQLYNRDMYFRDFINTYLPSLIV